MKTPYLHHIIFIFIFIGQSLTVSAQCPNSVDAISSASTLCAGDTISLSAVIDQGTADFVWTTSSGNVLNNPNSLILNNSNCQPGTLTYYLEATCTTDPTVVLEDSVSVTIYPSDPSPFVSSALNSVPGGCELVLEFDGTCGSYLSSSTQTYNVGDSGIESMTVTVSDPGSCLASSFSVDVPYDCQPGPCPTVVNATSIQSSICSGASTQISANVDMGTATYTWYRENGTVLTTNQTTNLTLNNNFCSPGILKYTVEAVCTFDPSIIVTDSIEITVYPMNISSFLSPVENQCVATLDVDPSCGSNVIVSDQNFNPGESGTANILVQYPSSNGCIPDFTVPVDYACSICPGSVSIVPSSFQVCSNTPFSLSAAFDQGNANLQWFNFLGNPISNPNTVVVSNSNCQPMNQNFSVQATCISDPSIVLTDNVTISIFPDDVSSYITPIDGDCNVSVQINPSCGSFVSAGLPQTFNPGESGSTLIDIQINTPNPCISDYSVSVNYDCPAVDCPTSLSLTSDVSEICNGGSVNLSASVDIGDITYAWTDASGANINPANISLSNTSCIATTETFTVTATCDDDNSIILTDNITIDIYPDDVSAFISPIAGGCTADVSIDPSCGGHLSSTAETFNAGESGTTIITVTSDNDPLGCLGNIFIPVNYDCPADIVCPSVINAIISSSQICSGTSISLNAFVDQGDVTYIWSDASGTTIADPSNVILDNSDCTPMLEEFTVLAICDDDNSIVLTSMVSVMVYNDNLTSFITPLAAGCTADVTIDPSCNGILSSSAQSFNAGESGTTNIAITVNDPSSCAADFSVPVAYDCPSNIVCPNVLDASASALDICSSDPISLSASVDQGDVTYNWFELSGTSIPDPSNVILANATCSPIVYELVVQAICEDDNSVILTKSVQVTVYNDDLTVFVSPQAGGCTADVSIDSSCAGILSSSAQTFNAGESGTANIQVTVNDLLGCVSDFTVPVSYDCPADIVCPTSLSAIVSSSEVCNGEAFSLSATVDMGDVTYTWTDPNGNTVSDPNNVALSNFDCTPETFDYTVVAICNDDNSVQLSEVVSIIVYNDNLNAFVSPVIGGCEVDVSIDSSCGTILSSSSQSFYPGQSGTAQVQVSVNDPSGCASNFSVPVAYDCPANIVCPASLTASSSLSSVCSNQQFVLSASVDMGNASYTWTDASGNAISTVHSESISSCSPETFVYTVTAVCQDDPSQILSETVSVMITPTDVSAFVTAIDGGCTASVSIDPSCNNIISASAETFNPGESGTTQILISSNDPSGCIADFSIPVAYDCPQTVSCLETLSISSSSSSICSGASISLNAVIDQGSANFIWFHNGTIISDPSDVVLVNTNCQAEVNTITATAVCSTDNSITFTESLDISVYPTDINSFLTPVTGACTASVLVDPSCGNSVIAQNQTFSPGESGIAMIDIFYSGDPACINDYSVPVSYDCPVEQTCIDFTLITSTTSTCSGDVVTVSGDIDGSPLTPSEFTLMANGQLVSGLGGVILNNNNCQPSNVMFIAEYICFDGTTVSDSVEVLVYPNDLSSFVTPNAGSCTAALSISPLCGSYLSSTTQSFSPGESGTAQITVSVDNGGSCNSDFTVAVPYDCPYNPMCPSSFTAMTSPSAVCSGEIFDLIAFVDQGDVDITWSYLGTVLPPASSLSLNNFTCAPNNVELIAEATCQSDSTIVLTEIVTIIIYPDNPSAFVSASTSSCTATLDIDSSCGNYLSYVAENFNPGESGVTDLTVEINSPNSCNSNFSVSVPYDCPSNPVCPTDIIPTLTSSEVCSGEIFSLSAEVDQGSATYEWSYSGNVFSNPNSISLANLGCSPLQTFVTVTATCDIDNSIILSEDVDITVFPDNPESFVSAVPGTCTAAVSIDPSCGTFLSASSLTFDPGQSGMADIPVSIVFPSACNSDFIVSVPYDCPAVVDCPSAFSINASETLICSNEIINLETDLDLNEVSIEWTIPGSSTPIVADAFSTIVNNVDCQPAVFTFIATATCDENPSIVVSESIDIVVFPTDVSDFLTASSGGCTASVSIDPTCGSFLTAQDISYMPGESGSTDILIEVTIPNDCLSDFSVPVNYNCPANSECPANVTASATSTIICSGESIDLNATVDQGMANFVWTDALGNTINPQNINLSNSDCNPITETFSLMATCIDDPSITYTETLSILVFPNSIENFLTAVINNCTIEFELDPTCDPNNIIYDSVAIEAGNSGTANIPVSFLNAPLCLNPIVLSVDYAIPVFNLEDVAVCSSSPGITISGVPPSYSCQWTPTDGLSDPNSCNPFISPNVTTSYSVLFTDGNGCSFTEEFTYIIIETDIDAGPDVAVCAGGNIQLNATGADSYVWSGGSLSCTNCADPIASPMTTTTYTVIGTDSNGCTSTDQVTITVDNMLSVNAGEDITICSGEMATIIASGGSEFEWISEGIVIGTESSLTVSPIVTTTYTLNASDGTCDGTDQITITVLPVPALVLSDISVCEGEAVTLNLPAEASSYTLCWPSDSLVLNAGDSFTPEYSGTYTLKTTLNACAVSQTFDIILTDEVNISISASQTSICVGESVELTASGASSYLWMPGSSLNNDSSTTVIASPITTTTYTVSGFSDSCGMDQVSITIEVTEADFSDIIYDSEVSGCVGDTVRITALPPLYSYNWSGGNFIDSVSSLSLLIIESDIDTVYLEANNSEGCSKTFPVFVGISAECDGVEPGPGLGAYEISNSFSPNGDMYNQTWTIPFLMNTESHHVKIFNRWGELLYSESDFSDGWDGIFNGEKLNDGTYYYVVQFEENGDSTTETGTVTIIGGSE